MTMKHDAFMYYSHGADATVAAALQSALHRFARPWNRIRAVRVFRDTTNLAANPELWNSIVDDPHGDRRTGNTGGDLSCCYDNSDDGCR